MGFRQFTKAVTYYFFVYNIEQISCLHKSVEYRLLSHNLQRSVCENICKCKCHGDSFNHCSIVQVLAHLFHCIQIFVTAFLKVDSSLVYNTLALDFHVWTEKVIWQHGSLPEHLKVVLCTKLPSNRFVGCSKVNCCLSRWFRTQISCWLSYKVWV